MTALVLFILLWLAASVVFMAGWRRLRDRVAQDEREIEEEQP